MIKRFPTKIIGRPLLSKGNNKLSFKLCPLPFKLCPLPFKNSYAFSSDNPRNIHPYVRLCRFDKPIGAMLLYWPTAWGVVAGASGMVSPHLLGLFLMGSWTSRSAGCIVNDYFDRDFDKKV